MLGRRLASAAVLIPIVGVAVYYGGYGLFALAAVAGLLAGYEYLAMLRHQGLAPSYLVGLLLVALFVVDAQWPDRDLLRWGLVLIPLGALAAEVFRANAPGSLLNWALALAGGIYVGLPLGFFIRLRALHEGLEWLVLALLGTWICDSAAYFVGRAMGKHKFFPKISPKKTWEGAISGLFFGIIAVVVLGHWLLDLHIGEGFILGVVIVLGATFGDLSESLVKRQVGVKDSGALIPGHGGMLDRIDSLLFVVPLTYFFATILGALP